MQAECRNGHPLPVRGLLAVRWCSRCSRYELRVWAGGTQGGDTATLLPEWASVVRLEDDEWAARTLAKHATGLAQSVRLLTEDVESGVLRLL